jgi:hypothetical protein
MTGGVLNRMLVAFGITAVALCGLNVPTSAQSQQGQPHQGDQKEKGQQKAQKKQEQDQKKQQQAQDQQQRQAQAQSQQRQRLTQQNQQVLIHQQEQRLVQYRGHLDQQQRAAQQQSAQLQQQNRGAQYSYQQQYMAGMRQQQLRVQSQGNYDYGRDLYLYAAPSYRYSHGGRYYETNQYGVDLLQQSVNYGYEQGRLAGTADQQDRWPFNYRSSYAYQDANYGYGGFYVDRYDYNNYFREGFRRGYEDGYYSRDQYGTYANGRTSLLGAVLGAILMFEAIR